MFKPSHRRPIITLNRIIIRLTIVPGLVSRWDLVLAGVVTMGDMAIMAAVGMVVVGIIEAAGSLAIFAYRLGGTRFLLSAIGAS